MLRVWISLMFLCVLFKVSAQQVPDDLAVWQDWVKHEQSFRVCPYFANTKSGLKTNHICAWPQQLQLNVQQNQATFDVTWEVLADSWVPLPGDSQSWPQAVTVNQKLTPVQSKNKQPRVFLQAGTHQIRGLFKWQSRPESIGVPTEMADIALTLEEADIKFPVRENQALWLGEVTNDEQVEANSLDIEVNRLFIDGHPMVVFMALDLQVSGVARNENLGKVISEQFQITDVSGGLNAYVDQAGDLWVQLKPGYSEVLISMNVLGWPSEFTFEALGEHWPKQEIWAYQDNKNIRLTQVEGVTAINPEQSSSRWFEVPNYLVNDGDVFVINEVKRGTLNQSEQMVLQRQAWLSFDGETFRTKDHINGDKFGSWRLNAGPDLQLLSAKNGDETLLITQSSETKQGVELRKPRVDLTIDGEFGQQFLKQISGWDISFESVQTQLFLPHGYMALASKNVDSSQHVWLEQWSLWDIFIVMLLTVLTFKVIGGAAAILALLALVLGYQNMNMPLYSWINLIIALGLLAWLPQGRLLRLVQTYSVLSVLVLAIHLLPFLVTEARLMIYPQLENQYQADVPTMSFSKVTKTAAPLNQVYEQKYSTKNAIDDEIVMSEEGGAIRVTGSRIKRADILNRYQTDATIQAGKGTPQWRYNPVVLTWDGPITAEQTYQLYLISPWMRVLWRLLLIVSAVMWLLLIIKHMRSLYHQTTKSAAHTSLVWMLGMMFTPSLWASDYPSDAMLKELQSRLYPAAACETQCASVEQASVKAVGNELTIQMTYHVLADVAVPLPYSADWQVTQVDANGKTKRSRLYHKNVPWLPLEQGIHQVKMTGFVASKNAISVRFPAKPGYVDTQSADWQFAGLVGNRLSGNTLQLIATSRTDSTTNESTQTSEIKPFVKLTRSITFDDQWYVNNTVSRVAPKQGVINLALPLLNNEFPVEKVQQDDQGQVLVNLGPRQDSYSWRSRLERLDQWTITASDNEQYVEIWHVVSSPQWHVEIEGVPLVAAENLADDFDDYFVHVYMPRPNESINIQVSRPSAVNGKVLSIDAINNTFTTGKRTTKTETKINYRATQGGQFEVHLDPAAVVKKVTFDGVESNLVNENGVVAVSYLPGQHTVTIQWHVNQELALISQTPSIQMNMDYSNLNQTIQMPRNRWLIWGESTGVGPAFLYWGELLVFVVLAFFLARIKYSPLKTWQWLALGCAFGTFSWLAFSWVASWLFFVGWKKQFTGFASNAKNILLQWFSLFFTLSALGVLIGAVAYGLLSYPDMGVAGSGASAYQLHWYLDSAANEIPKITLLSLPLWSYKLLILLWSIWVSFALLDWLKQILQSLEKGKWWPKFNRKKKLQNEKEDH